MPKLSPADVGRAVDVGAAHRRGLCGVVHQAKKAQVFRQFRLPDCAIGPRRRGRRSAAAASPKRSTHPRQRVEQHRHALARLVVAAQEQHRLARPRISVQRRRRGERMRRRPRWGSPPRRSPAPPSASAGPGRTPRSGRRSSRARAAARPETPSGSATWWSRCETSPRSGPRPPAAPTSTGWAHSVRAGAGRRSRRRASQPSDPAVDRRD